MIEEKGRLAPDGSFIHDEPQPEAKPFKRRKLDDEPDAGSAARIDKLKEVVAAIPKRRPEPEEEPEEEPEPIDEPAPEPEPEPEEEAARGPWPEPPKPPKDASDYERLLYPPGLLGHVVQYIYDTDPLPDRTMALAAALTIAGKSLDRKIVGPTGNSIILYNLILAETGAGKQHLQDCSRYLLKAIGLDECIVAGGIASVQAIEEVLHGKNENTPGNPSPLFILDEYGSFLSRITSKGMSGNVAEIPSILQTLWGWQPKVGWKGTVKVGRTNLNEVYSPALSILASSTDRSFYGAVKSKYVGGGFINRHLSFSAGRGAARRVIPKYHFTSPPPWLTKAMRRVAGKPALLDNRPVYFKGKLVKEGLREIGWGAGAYDHWVNFESDIRGIEDNEVREVWIRAPENALRIATIVAPFCLSGVVEIPHLKWCIDYVRHSTAELAKGLRKYMTEDLGIAEACDLLREQFIRYMIHPSEGRQRGEMTIGEIRKFLEKKIDPNKIMGVVYQLQYCGDIKELDPGEGPGRPTKKYLWLRGATKIR